MISSVTGTKVFSLAVADIHENVDGELAVLGPDRGRAARQLDRGDLTKRDSPAAWQGHQHVSRDRLRIAAQIARIAQIDAIALTTLYGRGNGLAAEGGRDGILHITDHETVARERFPVGYDVQIIAADDTFSKGARGARNRLHDGFDLTGKLLHLREVFSKNLDADRRTDSGRKHVGTCLDRHGPRVGDAGKLQRLVQLGDQAINGQAGPPLFL